MNQKMNKGVVNIKELMDHIDQTDYSIRNGMGQGFVTQPELFNNKRLEIGIGRSRSEANDMDMAFTSPIKFVIDVNFYIIETKYDSFPNSKESQRLEQLCRDYIGEEIPTKLEVSKKSNLFEKLFFIFMNKMGVMEHIGINDNYKEI